MMNSFVTSLLQLQLVCLLFVAGHAGVTRNSDGVERKISSANLPEGYVPFHDHQVAYKIHERLATWNEARERCMEEGGHLAIADSTTKIKNIKSLNNRTKNWLHIGIYDLASDNQWVRVDDDLPVATVPWAYGSPLCSGGCLGITLFQDGLADYECSEKRAHFVCEIPILHDDDNSETSFTEDQNKNWATTPFGIPTAGITVFPEDRTYGSTQKPTTEESYVVYPGDHVAYTVHVRQNLNWQEARDLCISKGGDLPIPDSKEKIARLQSRLVDRVCKWKWFPVGIYRSAVNKEWVRVDNNLPAESTPWGKSFGPGYFDDYNCAYVVVGGEIGQLGSLDCIWSPPQIVCEIPITEDSSEKGSTEEVSCVNIAREMIAELETCKYKLPVAVTEGIQTTYQPDTIPGDDVTLTYGTTEWPTTQGVETSTTPRSSKLPEGYVVYAEDHAAYKVHMQTLNWHKARDLCISEGGNLPIPDSEEKIARLHARLVNRIRLGKWYPVGIYRTPVNKRWLRVDNDLPAKSTPWGKWFEPGYGNAEFCAYVYDNGEISKLGGLHCDAAMSQIVCEIPIAEDSSEEGSSEEVAVTEKIQTTDQPDTISNDDVTFTYGTSESYTIEGGDFATVAETSAYATSDPKCFEATTKNYSSQIPEATITEGLVEIETTTGLPSKLLPEGYEMAKYDDNVAYKFHHNYVSWNEARDICESEEADLAVPEGASQRGEFIRHADDRNADLPHIGVRRSNRLGAWIRTDTGMRYPSLLESWKVGPRSLGYNCVGMSNGREDFDIYSCDSWKKPFICAKWMSTDWY